MKIEENDIRSSELMGQQKLALEHDISYLQDRKDAFIDVSCPACGKNGVCVLEKNGFQYFKCVCDTLYMNPRPSESLLCDFYVQSENYKYWNKYIFPASEEKRRKGIHEPRVDRLLGIIEKYSVGQNAFLEVGAGFGTFSESVKKRGCFERVVALEMTGDLAQTCRNKDLEVIEEPVEECQLPDESFDVIVSFEVLEHLFDPGFFISKVKRLLKKSGILVLSNPNIEGFDVMTLGLHSDTIDHEHLNYFNPRSMRILFENHNLEVIEISTPGVLDASIVRNKVLDGTMNLDNQPFLKYMLIDHWEACGESFQTFIQNMNMSTHMWSIARKS